MDERKAANEMDLLRFKNEEKPGPNRTNETEKREKQKMNPTTNN